MQCDHSFWGDVELSGIIAMLDIAFQLKRAVRVEDSLWNGNTRQLSLLQRAGFIKEGTLKKKVWRGGEWLDEVIVGITDDDYVNLWMNTVPHWNIDEIKSKL